MLALRLDSLLVIQMRRRHVFRRGQMTAKPIAAMSIASTGPAPTSTARWCTACSEHRNPRALRARLAIPGAALLSLLLTACSWGQGVEAGPIYAAGLGMGLFTSIFGAPNNWAVDKNGKFTATFETDQYKAATAYVKDLYTAGIFHLDSSNYNTISARDAFQARKFAFRYDGLEMFGWRKPPGQLTPAPNIQLVKPFGASGGPGSYWYGRPNFGYVVMPKTLPADRIKMLLRVLNYLAAPFCPQGALLLRFRLKDVEWISNESGSPQFTEKGQADFMPWRNIVAPAPHAYLPGNAPEFPGLLQ